MMIFLLLFSMARASAFAEEGKPYVLTIPLLSTEAVPSLGICSHQSKHHENPPLAYFTDDTKKIYVTIVCVNTENTIYTRHFKFRCHFIQENSLEKKASCHLKSFNQNPERIGPDADGFIRYPAWVQALIPQTHILTFTPYNPPNDSILPTLDY